MTYDEIVELVIEMKISDKMDLTFRSGVMMLYQMFNKSFLNYEIILASRVTRKCKISFTECLKIQRNLRKNNILIDGQIYMTGDYRPGTTEWIIEFTIYAMAGAGQIISYNPNS